MFGRLDRGLPDEGVKAGMKVKIRVLSLDNDRLSYELIPA